MTIGRIIEGRNAAILTCNTSDSVRDAVAKLRNAGSEPCP
jgi:hypothetical protein